MDLKLYDWQQDEPAKRPSVDSLVNIPDEIRTMTRGYEQMLEANRMTGLKPLMKQQDYVGAYASSWAFACMSLVSISMAAQKPRLVAAGKEIEQHAALDLIRNPNPMMTGQELDELTALYTDLAGECFWILERTPLRVPAEIWLVLPWQVELHVGASGLIDNYVVSSLTTGKQIKVPFEDMVHHKQANPLNPYRGMSTIQAAAMAIDSDRYAAKYNLRHFENSAIPAGVLQASGFVDQETREEIEQKWSQGHKGTDKAGRTAVLSGGLEYKPLGISQKDQEYLEGRAANRDEILGIVGIPKSAIGLVEDVNRANAETGEYTLARRVIAPRLARKAATLNKFLISQFDTRLEIEYDDPVPEDQDRRIKKFDTGVARGTVLIDEHRKEMALPALADAPSDGIVLIPVNTYPMTVAELLSGQEPQVPGASAPKTFKKPVRSAVARYNTNVHRSVEPKFKKRLKGLYKAQGAKVLAALDEQKSVEKVVAEPLIHIVLGDKDYIAEAMSNHFKTPYQMGIDLSKEVLDLPIDFTLDHPAALEALKRMPNKFAEDITQTTASAIREQVAAGMANGEGIPEITARLKDVYDKAQGYRAEVAARTETANAFSQGSLDSWKQAEIPLGKSWLWSGDNCRSGVCPDNENAGVIGLDDIFPSGDDCPAAHESCTCCICPEVLD